MPWWLARPGPGERWERRFECVAQTLFFVVSALFRSPFRSAIVSCSLSGLSVGGCVFGVPVVRGELVGPGIAIRVDVGAMCSAVRTFSLAVASGGPFLFPAG